MHHSDDKKVAFIRHGNVKIPYCISFQIYCSFDKASFRKIVDLLKADFPTGRNAISPEKRVGLFLSFCADESTQYRAGHMAGIGRNQTSVIIREVAKALVDCSRDYIKWPSRAEMRRLSEENNEAFGIPGCPLGVDGES